MNWPQIITDIRNQLGSYRVISERTGIPPTTMAELVAGRTVEPRYSSGAKLIELHERICS